MSYLSEDREQDKSGKTTCGVFIPLPYDLAKDFPRKDGEDDSLPHITLLFAGNLSPEEFQKLSLVVRQVCWCIKPFELDLKHYSEFKNRENKRIAHMFPSCNGATNLAILHGILRKAAEKAGVKIEHKYDGQDKSKKLPYELRYLPHAALAYLKKGEDYKGPRPTGSWRVSEVEVWGYEKIRVPLGRNHYDQPLGLTKDPVDLHYPMAVPDPLPVESILSREPLVIESQLAELRDSCGNCILKHLGQAAALMDETKQGYPLHRWLVVGHMGEAASEALKDYPDLADEIREHRLKYAKDPNYVVPIMDLIGKAHKLMPEHNVLQEPHTDQIPGGKADKNKPEDFDPEQIKMGIEVEKEHTKDENLAREIASDHLREFGDYYSRLKKMEKDAKEDKTQGKNEDVSLRGYEFHHTASGAGSGSGAPPLNELERFMALKKLKRSSLGAI